MPKKIALGLSGGVDSALSAHLLVEQGYEVHAVYIECWNEPGCRAELDRKDALQIALKLGIPFQVLDYKKEYQSKVMQYFLDEYKAGRTPNPDIMCNKIIKFGLFYDWAIKQNHFDAIATGHYAQIQEIDGVKTLTCSQDLQKDQTYFLYQVEAKQLNHILFPIGHLLKSEVRSESKKRDISVAQKKDSVGICFVGDINVRAFIKENLGENPGDVVDGHGKTIGTHNGLWFYTLGQRQGFFVDTKKLARETNLLKDIHTPPPLYVLGKDVKKNQLIVGPKIKTKSDHFLLKEIHWIQGKPPQDVSLLTRIRHTGKLTQCSIFNFKNTPQSRNVDCHLEENLEGIASGQSAVFYKKHKNQIICLGGGIIENLK